MTETLDENMRARCLTVKANADKIYPYTSDECSKQMIKPSLAEDTSKQLLCCHAKQKDKGMSLKVQSAFVSCDRQQLPMSNNKASSYLLTPLICLKHKALFAASKLITTGTVCLT